ncbi:MAG: LytTR family DNA-binding domain-containing protein, partial [Myxococcota bacterium]
AVEAFAVQGLDYLLKPVERDRLGEALRRVRQRLWSRASPGMPVDVVEDPGTSTITGFHGAREEPVPTASIVFVEIDDGVAFAERVDGPRIRLADSLGELEASLPSPPFVRVSRSALVNLERVEGLRAAGSGTCEAELTDGHVVAVSRRRTRHLRKLLGLDAE